MNKCCICFNSNFIKCHLSCNHLICIECLLLLEESKCPFCKKNINNEIPENLLKILKNNLRKKLNC